MRGFCGVCQLLTVLLAANVAAAMDPSHILASERSSIESTYELTKYLEYQLKEIKDVYLTYLGPPFNEKDFSPPRPNSTALALPSAATRLELWHGLENQARLAQNQRAYSILLTAVRELARSTLCPSLKTSLLHFCTGLDGLLGSISALMNSLGYSSSPQGTAGELHYAQRGAGGNHPAPLMSQSLYRSRAGSRTEPSQRGSQRRSRIKTIRGEREGGELMDRRRGRAGKRAESAVASGRSSGLREKGRGERVRREDRQEQVEIVEELNREMKSLGTRRRLLSIEDIEDKRYGEPKIRVEVSYQDADETRDHQHTNSNQYSFSLNSDYRDTLREDGFLLETNRKFVMKEENTADMDSTSSSSFNQHHRRPRSLLYPTLPPPLSTLSLLYQIGVGEEHTLLPQPVPLSLQRGTSLLSPPLSPLLSSSTSTSSSLLPVRPTMNDFARKVEGFWILRELQSWLWRSAKDFNRLKKRLRG
ncbi:uncharacterized protein clcf1 [Cyprinodon tularosa]|uniref:Cardiotrophin-like cytokine factor 1 n=1 Tax=Cyprinodon variegatus TaxID=28743 RepID=A0A3Q2DE91_CYPVA|nr:PREDICTED: cardiotrophin-like cytokine factor 1 [Cyprinodon variegatus]XP_038148510.1 uncharacterized protein clcf1 [Cyprinodon tularosa]